MTAERPVPKRRSNPDLQNYIYEGETGRTLREKAERRAAKKAKASDKLKDNGKT
jgi:hypothetical protein